MSLPTVVADPNELSLEGTILSIGNFDGVHHGHRRLLERMSGLSAEQGAPSVVITFFPPSKVVFGGGDFLSSIDEKLELLRPFSPTAVAVIPFSREYSQTDKSVFLEQLTRLRPAAIIVGEDFRFGHGRRGTLADLGGITPQLEVFGLEQLDGEVVKSSSIRRLLAAGAVKEAARLLGAHYLVIGEAGRTDDGEGLRITVSENKAVPAGVFAVRVQSGTESWGALACNDDGLRGHFDLLPIGSIHGYDGHKLRIRFVARLADDRSDLQRVRQEAELILAC